MIINGKRALAYTQKITNIQPIAGADNIELVHVNAWPLIAIKGEFQEGDTCVFFEIDSQLPEEERYEFLRKKGFKVKTYELRKFHVVSQGLALPLSLFPEISADTPVDTDVTDVLHVTYYVKEDNVRKENDPAMSRFNTYKAKHRKFYNNRFIKFLMKFKWFRTLQKRLHGGKPVRKLSFPSQYVSKTDEERCQNMPWVLANKDPMIVTEKIDGTSTTVLVERLPHRKFRTYICSRNVCYGDGTGKAGKRRVYDDQNNIYVENANRYHMPERLTQYLKDHPDIKWACIQGESYGLGWQGNPLKCEGHEFAAFNFKDSKNGRWGSLEGKKLLADWGIPWVPIIHTNYILPDTVDELITAATGKSALNDKVLREGWVIRSQDGQLSFKAVSTEYLLKKGE